MHRLPLLFLTLLYLSTPPPTLAARGEPPAEYACKPMGTCEPCPPDQLDTAPCRRFGNRRLVHCVYLGTTSPAVAAAVLHGGGVHPVAVEGAGIGLDARRWRNRGRRRSLPSSGEAAGDASRRRRVDEEGEESEPAEGDREAGNGEGGAAEEPQGEEKPQEDAQEEEDRIRIVDEENGIGTGEGGASFPTWEACERVVARERADFFEFVLCNLFFALASLAVFLLRHRKLAARQYGRLAARIGIPISFVGGASPQPGLDR